VKEEVGIGKFTKEARNSGGYRD